MIWIICSLMNDVLIFYFREDDSKYLGWLHNMLTTYTYFHRDVGYTQGMNDIAASFLSTFQNEVILHPFVKTSDHFEKIWRPPFLF